MWASRFCGPVLSGFVPAGPRVFGAGGARGTQPGSDVSHELSVGSSEGRWNEEPGSDSDLVGVRHPLSRCRPLARSVC